MSENELVRFIYSLYETVYLNRKQTSKLLGISLSTLDRLKESGKGPDFIKDNTSKNGRVIYSIHVIAKYIISQQLDCCND